MQSMLKSVRKGRNVVMSGRRVAVTSDTSGLDYPFIVYREGDIVKQPMKKGSFVPKNVPEVGWGGVGGS